MDRTEFEFFVVKHDTSKTEKGTEFKLKLKSGAGHTLTFKSKDESIFEGYPIGQAVGVKLGNPQTTLRTP
jgi:uncharacterized protein YjlB